MPTIIFNGKTYHSIADMPANERQAFEQMSQMFVDANGNGIPDFLEGDMVQNVLAAHSSQMGVIHADGKTYHTLEDLPPALRQRVDGAFQMLSNMGIVQEMPNAAAKKPPAPIRREPAFESKPLEPQGSSVIQEESGRSVFTLVLGGVVLCFAIVVVTIGALYLLNR
ncbi:MAG: hypothetical protein HXY38_07535 [Chloroflexi bacterium]|nr:hypothetical protein [Chloroflexota bacterium]